MFDAKDTFQTFLGDGCLLACLGCISPASLVTEENPMEGLSQSSVRNEKEKKRLILISPTVIQLHYGISSENLKQRCSGSNTADRLNTLTFYPTSELLPGRWQ